MFNSTPFPPCPTVQSGLSFPARPGPVPPSQPVIAHVGTARSVCIDSPQIVTVLSVLTVEENARLAIFWGSLCAPAIVLKSPDVAPSIACSHRNALLPAIACEGRSMKEKRVSMMPAKKIFALACLTLTPLILASCSGIPGGTNRRRWHRQHFLHQCHGYGPVRLRSRLAGQWQRQSGHFYERHLRVQDGSQQVFGYGSHSAVESSANLRRDQRLGNRHCQCHIRCRGVHHQPGHRQYRRHAYRDSHKARVSSCRTTEATPLLLPRMGHSLSRLL